MPSRHVKNVGREGGRERSRRRGGGRRRRKKEEEIRITIPSLSPRATVSIPRPAPVHGAPKGTRRVKPCTLRLTDVSPSPRCTRVQKKEVCGGEGKPPRQHTRHRPGQGCHLSASASGFPPAVPREAPAPPANPPAPLLADRLNCALLAAACLRKWNRSSASRCRRSSRRRLSVCTEGRNGLARPGGTFRGF